MSLFKNNIVGIDFHDYSAEIVEVSIRGKNKYLEAYNRIAIPSDVIVNGEIRKKEELKALLKSLFQGANPHPIETKTIAITFPSSKVITHIFSFPAGLSEAEIKKAITYEAETVIPFSINDIYWDCAILEKEDASKAHSSQYVLFACINKQIADQYCALFEEIETSPVLFSVTPDALKYSLAPELLINKTNLVIDIDTLAVNYLVIQNSITKHFFSANEGGRKLITDLAQESQMMETAIVELKERNQLDTIKCTEMKCPEIINNFIEKNYKRAAKIAEEYEASGPGRKIDQILLTGKYINLPNFMKLAKSFFPNCQVTIGDPKLGLIIEPTRFNLEAVDEKEYIPYSIYFNNSIGSALRALTSYSNGVNLLPDQLKESFDTRKRSWFISISAILMTLLILATSVFITIQLQRVSYLREHLKSEKSAVDKMIYGTRYQEIKNEISTFNNEVSELKAIDGELFSVPTTIRQIQELMPTGIAITSFSFMDNDLSFEISGIADDRTALLEAQNNLKKAEFIEEVIDPISNYDEKITISFKLKIKLAFTKLTQYGSSSTTK